MIKFIFSALLMSACFTSQAQDLRLLPPASKTNPVKNFAAILYPPGKEGFTFKSDWPIAFNFISEGISKNYDIGVFLSKDSLLSPEDYPMNIYGGPEIDCSRNCNGSFGTGFNIQVPCGVSLTNGIYYFIIKLDVRDKIVEINKTNNIGYIQFTYTDYSCGEVVISHTYSPSQLEKGNYFTPSGWNVLIANNSSEKYTPPSDIQFYLSKDLERDESDVPLNTFGWRASLSFQCNQPLPIITALPYTSRYENEFFICGNNSLQVPLNIGDGLYYLLPQLGFNSTAYVRYASNPIQIGTLTGLEGAEVFESSKQENVRFYTLTGQSVTAGQARGKLVIAHYPDATRKLLLSE